MTRIDIIQALITKCNATRYLEIGTQKDVCFRQIVCDNKTGVDPERGGTHRMTSDEFFKQNKAMFDVIFIDGLHHSEQMQRDVLNSLKVISKDGYIVCHDCNPVVEEEQRVPRETKRWNGDIWKSWTRLRWILANKMFVVNTDEGCGVLCMNETSSQLKSSIPPILSYSALERNRKEYLGLITVKEFEEWL